LGGRRSTRWNGHEKKGCVEDCLTLDIDQLVSAGLFNHPLGVIEYWSDGQKTAGIAFRLKPSDVPEILYLYLFYAVMNQGKTELHEQPIPIEIRRQRIGKRYFFRCYLFCISRVRKLHRPTMQTVFGCRGCHKPTYRSTQQHDKAMEFISRNPESLLAAVEAGLAKAIRFVLRTAGIFEQRPQAILKVSGLK
jgi:hypothetical protein